MKIFFSYNDFGFQKILDDFKNSNYINIVTYNISSPNSFNDLLNSLKRLENKYIRIVTNIPKRYSSYYSTNSKKNAAKMIEEYLKNLEPISFKSNVEIYFNFKNHSKIYSTDNYTYIGSQNFSDQSKNNYEVGIILDNREENRNYGDNFIEELIYDSKDTIRFYGTNIEKLKEKIQIFIKEIYNIIENIDIKIEYYYTGYEFICEVQKKFEKINNILKDIKILINDTQNIIKEYQDKNNLTDVDFIDELNQELENIIDEIEEFLFIISRRGDFSEIYYDPNQAILENIYDADEEHLEEAIERETPDAYDYCDDIMEKYENEILGFFDSFKIRLLHLINITETIEKITSNYDIINNTIE